MTDIFSQCLDILKREDVKYKMKEAFEPVISLLVDEFKPYIYIGMCMIFTIFIMILTILTLLIFIYKSQFYNLIIY
jgi:magnesium-transporting ATPase (P-type)